MLTHFLYQEYRQIISQLLNYFSTALVVVVAKETMYSQHVSDSIEKGRS